jgi:dipeptidyl aminopeptidase/acylaminoacyl peptidase
MRVVRLSIAAGLIGVALASMLATENAMVIRDRSGPPLEPAQEIARVTGSEWEGAQISAADGAVLRAWLFTPARPNGGDVILFHGVGDTRLGMMGHAGFLLRAGYRVLTPDSRGHGASGGAVSYGVREADDVHRWAGWLAGRGGKRLYGLGESLGAAILLQSLAREPRFRAVVAECPFATFQEVARHRLAQATGAPAWAFWPVIGAGFTYARVRFGVNLWDASSVAAARAASTPVLLIHGERDTNIPPEHSREIAAADPRARLWIVPRARPRQRLRGRARPLRS